MEIKVVNMNNYSVGYIQFGNINIWATIGEYYTVCEELKNKVNSFNANYQFYE